MGRLYEYYRDNIKLEFQHFCTFKSSYEDKIYTEYVLNRGLPIQREVPFRDVGIADVQFSGKAITMSGDFFAFVKRRTDLSDASIKDLTTMIEDYKGDTESFAFDFVRWDGAGKNKKVLSIVESNQSQHYEPIDNTNEAKLKFAQQLVRDYLKEILTKKHNIPFYAHNAYLYSSPSVSRAQKRKMDIELDMAFCCDKLKEDL